MLIAREYEWFGLLYDNDSKAKALIDEAFSLVQISPEEKKKLLDYNYFRIPAFMDLGCGIPGKAYKYMIDGFRKIDTESAYDNGLSFGNVTKIEYETSRKGTAIQMRFVREDSETPYRIVGFSAIKNTNNKIEMIKCWRMSAPFLL